VIHFNFSRLFTLHFLCGFSFFRSDLYLSFLLTIFSEYLCFCISYSWNHAGTFHQVLFFFPFESPSPFLKLLEFANAIFIFFLLSIFTSRLLFSFNFSKYPFLPTTCMLLFLTISSYHTSRGLHFFFFSFLLYRTIHVTRFFWSWDSSRYGSQ